MKILVFLLLLGVSADLHAGVMCAPEVENPWGVGILHGLTFGFYPRSGVEGCEYSEIIYDYVMRAQAPRYVAGEIVGALILFWIADTLRIIRKRVIHLIIALNLIQIPFVQAEDNVDIEDIIYRSSVALNVDSKLVKALMTTESGRYINGKVHIWPWTLRVGDQSLFYETRAEAEHALDSAIKKGAPNIDVGLWQVSIRWNGSLVKYPKELLDPRINSAAGIKVLSDCLHQYASTREALSCYNSGNVDIRGLQYAETVLARMEGRRKNIAPDSNVHRGRVQFVEGLTSR